MTQDSCRSNVVHRAENLYDSPYWFTARVGELYALLGHFDGFITHSTGRNKESKE